MPETFRFSRQNKFGKLVRLLVLLKRKLTEKSIGCNEELNRVKKNGWTEVHVDVCGAFIS